ncbi:MAG: hypothetical protein VZQ61_06790 [Christensenellaceae bacterium]
MKGLWARLPFHIRIQIIAVGGAVFLFLLLITSCAGSADSGVQEIENASARSSEAFYIQRGDGAQEIYDFNNADAGESVGALTLVAKKAVELRGLYLGTSPLSQDVAVYVIAVGLPKENETEPNDEETELFRRILRAGEFEHDVATGTPVVIPENLIVIIKFASTVNLEFIAADFKEINI